MKRILYTLLFSVLLLSSSCKKFLETQPKDFLSPENYYNTEADVNAAVTGIYDVLGKTGTYGRYLYLELDNADEGFIALSSWTQDVALYNYSPSDIKITATWTLLYDGINRANMLLENISKANMDENKKTVAQGEALFLRSYFLFVLTSNWGDIPLKLKATVSSSETNFPKSSYKEVYTQIAGDMEKAAGMVNSISTYSYTSRVTKEVIWGVLARVNLKMAGMPLHDISRFAEARKWADMVIKAQTVKLNPDYKQVFINHCADLYDLTNKESMWEVEFGKRNGTQAEEGAVGSINGIGTGNTAIGYSYGARHTTKRYYDLFGSKDLRRDWSISPYSYTSTTSAVKVNFTSTQIYNRFDAKWRREYETATPKFNGTTSINFPLLRYADVLLMFAEAENEVTGPTAGAYAAINAVRERAFGVTTGNATLAEADLTPGMDQIAFREAVRKERSLELGYEGLRRFDLIRWGQFIPVMKSVASEIAASGATYSYGARSGQNISDRDTLFAIPANEISLNHDITQNKGF